MLFSYQQHSLFHLSIGLFHVHLLFIGQQSTNLFLHLVSFVFTMCHIHLHFCCLITCISFILVCFPVPVGIFLSITVFSKHEEIKCYFGLRDFDFVNSGWSEYQVFIIGTTNIDWTERGVINIFFNMVFVKHIWTFVNLIFPQSSNQNIIHFERLFKYSNSVFTKNLF